MGKLRWVTWAVALFALMPAAVAGGVNTCTSPTTCVIDGLTNNALGQAQLSLDGSLNLVVSNIGGSGEDGVEILNDCGIGSGAGGARTAHEPWIDLGLIEREPINFSTSGTGSLFDSTATGSFSASTRPFYVLGSVNLHTEKIDATQIEVTTDFSITGANGLRYDLLNGGAFVGSVNGSLLGSAIRAPEWPTLEAFSEVGWNAPLTLTIVEGDTTLLSVTADEVEIHPLNATRTLLGVGKVTHRARDLSVMRSLESFTIVREEIGADCVEVIPTMSEWLMIVMALLLLGAGVLYVRRLF